MLRTRTSKPDMANKFLDYFLKNILPSQATTHDKAQEVVRAHVLWAVGGGLVPIPVLDIAAVSAVQWSMIQQLAKLYKQDASEALTKSVISALTGSTLARLGASLVKAIPVVGSIVGGVSMAVLAGASTYAVGQVFTMHFEAGGTLEDLDVNAYRRAYDQFFKEGKTVAESLQKDREKAAAEDPFVKLEKLSRLKERGIITEEEFLAKKDELLKSV